MVFRRKKSLKGITLVELLVVLAILGLLIASFFVGFTQIQKAKDAKKKADLEKIKTALYDYYFDHDCFPEELPDCGEDFGENGTPYLADFPCDSKGEPYVYVTRKGGKCKDWFRVFTNLEFTPDLIIDKIHCRTGCGPDGEDPDNKDCDYNYGVASTNTDLYRNCSDAYVCAPGKDHCERYEDPYTSQCPIVFGEDSTCGEGQCADPANRCENASGKSRPEE
ncbi:MAG TPA: prepilin-type N-terminal cleavage/methylation domain-containing protein [Candidatus Bathyarchaeia archaeon]|nr:prepilin-type N-terminal cleavage/methylation domain-containing protein [Candidatus Bathyarchaeia archaeon]